MANVGQAMSVRYRSRAGRRVIHWILPFVLFCFFFCCCYCFCRLGLHSKNSTCSSDKTPSRVDEPSLARVAVVHHKQEPAYCRNTISPTEQAAIYLSTSVAIRISCSKREKATFTYIWNTPLAWDLVSDTIQHER